MLVRYVVVMTAFCLGVVTLGRAADQFPADTGFVRKAEQAGRQETADARGALALSKSRAIHEIAQRIEKGEAVVLQQLGMLSLEKGWPAPTLDPPGPMSQYSDHRFVVRQIQLQQDALALYAEEAANGADSELQELARATVPILRQRLISLRSLRTS